MAPRERAKRAQELLLKACQHPLCPADVRGALGEISVLLGEWGDILSTMKGNSHVESITPGPDQVP